MAKFGKFFAWTAVIGAAVAGGVAYFKKKGADNTSDTVEDDFDDEKIFNVDVDCSDEDRKYVSITLNAHKAKEVINDAKDTIGDVASKAKDKVSEIVGEDKLEEAKETVVDFASDAKDWAADSAEKAMDFAKDAKDKIKDSVSRHMQDSYEFDEDDTVDETEANEGAKETETSATTESGADDSFLTEEIDDEINE